MALTSAQITTFNAVLDAARNRHLALVECRRLRDGVITAVLCAAAYDGDDVCFTPLAEIVAGDALAMCDPPDSGGGFQ